MTNLLIIEFNIIFKALYKEKNIIIHKLSKEKQDPSLHTFHLDVIWLEGALGFYSVNCAHPINIGE